MVLFFWILNSAVFVLVVSLTLHHVVRRWKTARISTGLLFFVLSVGYMFRFGGPYFVLQYHETMNLDAFKILGIVDSTVCLICALLMLLIRSRPVTTNSTAQVGCQGQES